ANVVFRGASEKTIAQESQQPRKCRGSLEGPKNRSLSAINRTVIHTILSARGSLCGIGSHPRRFQNLCIFLLSPRECLDSAPACQADVQGLRSNAESKKVATVR